MKRHDSHSTEHLSKKTKLDCSSQSLIHLANIFLFLDPITDLLPNVMAVCEKFFEILGGKGTLDTKHIIYEKIILKSRMKLHRDRFDKAYFVRLVDFVSRAACVNACKVLKLGNNYDGDEGLSLVLTIDFFKKSKETGCFNGLKKLSLFNISMFKQMSQKNIKILKEWGSSLSNLEELHLNNLIPQDVMNAILIECKNLKHLTCVSGNLAINDDMGPFALESLDISTSDDNDINYSFFTRTPHLKKLAIGFNYCFSNTLFLNIRDYCRELTEFSYGERDMNETGNLQIMMQMNQLEKVCINTQELDVDIIRHIVNTFKLKMFPISLGSEGDFSDILEVLEETLELVDDSYVLYQAKPETNFLQKCKKFKQARRFLTFGETLENNHVTIGDLFEELPLLNEVLLTLSIENIREQSLKGANQAFKLIHGKEGIVNELFNDTTFYTKIETQSRGSLKLRVRIVDFENMDYEQDEQDAIFKISLVK